MDGFTGTKERIFDTFIEMTSGLGYENVSIRDITNRLGLKPASLYNHFASKDDLLDAVYAYYTSHLFDNRKSADTMKKMLMEDSAENIVFTLAYTFVCDDLKKYTRMILTTKIIYMRLFQDQGANSIYMDAYKNNFEYVSDIMKYGVDAGRVDPGFDYETFAGVLIGANHIMGINAFARPEYAVGQLDEQNKILRLLAQLLNTALISTDRICVNML